MSNSTQQHIEQPSASPNATNNTKQLYSFLNFSEITKLPCFRDSALWAIGTGAILGIFQYTRTRHTPTMLNYAFGSAGIAGIGNYILCRYQFKRQRDTVRFYMQNQDELKKYVEQQKLAGKATDIQTNVIQPEVTDDPTQQNTTRIK